MGEIRSTLQYLWDTGSTGAAASRQQDFGEAELKGAARVSRRHEPREAELKGAERVSRRQECWEAESEVAIQLHDFWAEGSEVAAVSLAPESSQAQENRMDWGFPIQTYLASLERGSRPEPTIDSGGDPGQQKTGAIQLCSISGGGTQCPPTE